MIAIDAAEYRQLKVFADSWVRFWDEGLLADLVDREVAVQLKAISVAVSGARHWGGLGPSWAALQRIRDRPAWVRRCRGRSCTRTETVYSAAAWREPWWCGHHAGQTAVAA